MVAPKPIYMSANWSCTGHRFCGFWKQCISCHPGIILVLSVEALGYNKIVIKRLRAKCKVGHAMLPCSPLDGIVTWSKTKPTFVYGWHLYVLQCHSSGENTVRLIIDASDLHGQVERRRPPIIAASGWSRARRWAGRPYHGLQLTGRESRIVEL